MKRITLSILLVLLIANLSFSQYTKIWEKSKVSGNYPTYLSASDFQRGISYGKVGGNDRLFVASRNGGNFIYILNAATGDSVDVLSTADMTGGTYVLNDIEVSNDGIIFVCNLTTNASSSAFKVYKWTAESDAPVAAINYTSSTLSGYRMGDKFTVTGSASDNSLVIWALANGAAGTNTKLVKFSTADNGTTFTATEVTLNTALAGSSPAIAPINNGSTSFYVKSNSKPIIRYNADGSAADTIALNSITTSGNALRYFENNGKKYIIMYAYGTNNEDLYLINITNGSVDAVLEFATPSLGVQTNSNGVGDISIKNNSDGTFTAFVLGTNNGIASYKLDFTPESRVTIQQAKADANSDFIPDLKGATITVKGVVTTPDYTLSATGGSTIYMQDETAGFAIRTSSKKVGLAIGDSIIIKGKLDLYRGLAQIAAYDSIVGPKGSFTLIKSGAKLPVPAEITLVDVNSEKYEGSLVTVKGLSKKSTSVAWPVAAADANMSFVDAKEDSTILRIDQDTDIDGQVEPVWPQNITGVVTQFTSSASKYDDGYQLQPRSYADFQSPVPPDTTPVVSIAVAREDLNNDFVTDRKGQIVKISGVVISPDFTASTPSNNNYYISDGNAGILLYTKPKLSSVLNIGDSVLIKGKIDQYKGVTEIVPVDSLVGESGSVVIIKSNVKTPAPVEISLKELNSEKYEGCLVKVKGLAKTPSSPAWPAATKNANMRVFAGTDSTILFIDADTDIDGSTEVTWPQDITGIATQYASSANNDGYEIMPRSIVDFNVAAEDTFMLATIADARFDGNSDFIPDHKGRYFKVTGVVISPDFTASTTSNNNYYISDGEAGILLYAKPKLNAALNIGDSVLVRGKIDHFRGVTEIVPVDTLVGSTGSVVVLKTNAKVPAPVEISLKDLNSEKYEGCLVKVKGLSKTPSSPAWPLAAKNANMRVFAGADSTILFIDSDTDIDGSTEVAWPQDITGIATQYTSSATVYNDGYEIMPRNTADFTKTSGIEGDSKALPKEYALDQNYPNPFNPSTTIKFALKVDATVTLKIYSVIGQEVVTLVNNSSMSAGHQIVNFNASALTSGIYLYRLDVKGNDGSHFSSVKKMMLLK